MKPVKTAERILCKCGCGEEIWDRDKQYRKIYYKWGHQRIKPRRNINCSCGCGQEITTIKEGKVFIHGHNWRGKSRGGMTNVEKLGEDISCACGCGETIKEYRINKHGKRYRVKMQVGHNRRGADVKHFWKGGKTEETKRFKQSGEYRRWRKAVFERDNYTCQICGARNGKGVGKTIELHPDHIKPFSQYPELRTELSNGRTLCAECHRKTDTYGIKLVRSSRQNGSN